MQLKPVLQYLIKQQAFEFMVVGKLWANRDGEVSRY